METRSTRAVKVKPACKGNWTKKVLFESSNLRVPSLLLRRAGWGVAGQGGVGFGHKGMPP